MKKQIIFIICGLIGAFVVGAYYMHSIQLENQYDEYLEAGREAQQKKDTESAITYYEKATKLISKKADAFCELSNLYLDMGEKAKVQKICDDIYNNFEKGQTQTEIDYYTAQYNFMNGMKQEIESENSNDSNIFVQPGALAAELSILSNEFVNGETPDYILYQKDKMVSDLKDGQAMIYDKDEGFYIGGIKHGVRSGQGTQYGYYNEDSMYYVMGNWNDNRADGQCEMFMEGYLSDTSDALFIAKFDKGLMNGNCEVIGYDGRSEFKADEGTIDSWIITEEGEYICANINGALWKLSNNTGFGTPLVEYTSIYPKKEFIKTEE